MKKLLSLALCLVMIFSAFATLAVTASAEPNEVTEEDEYFTEGDYTYCVLGNEAAIVDYSGEGGAIVIPSKLGEYTVKSIGCNAFKMYGSFFTRITLPEGLEVIGENAFSYETKLVRVYLPKSLKTIGRDAFKGCTALKDVFYSADSTDREKLYIGAENKSLTDAAWHYNYTKDAYKGASNAAEKTSSGWIWVVVAVAILAAGGATLFIIKKKRTKE